AILFGLEVFIYYLCCYTSRGFILCIDLFRIASGFAFAGDAVIEPHRVTGELRSSEAIRNKYRSFVSVCVT
ncbi:MAG: hypothetical protein LBG45_11415, partial [Dysgonamonadaceae bacterium]|nr:hypothetical protein [Dysgonamonadaceae bacterium]